MRTASNLRTWWAEGRPLVSRWAHTKDGMDLSRVGRAANAYHHHTRWVRRSWWKYILAKPVGATADYHRVVWCRLKGHPNGYVYFNPGGMEPDYSCKDCGEEI